MAGHPIFLRWAEPPGNELDPRRARPDGDWRLWPAVFRDGAAGALSHLRGGRPDGPRRRIIVSAGDAPELLAGIDAGLRRPGDELVLLPPTVNGCPEMASLALALAGGAPGSALVVTGAVTPAGALAPLAEIGELCTETRSGLMLDLTLARHSPLLRDPWLKPAGFVAALDRWDGAAPGTWGALRAPEPLPATWSAPPAPALLHLDGALRGALADQAGVTVWPLGTRRCGTGVVGFAIRGWSAEEAAAVLWEAFGIALEAGPLTAAPLPVPDEFGRGLLRASLGGDSKAEHGGALAAAVSRLACSRAPSTVSH